LIQVISRRIEKPDASKQWAGTVSNGNFVVSEFVMDATLTTLLPAALPLFATGLDALGLLGWRRKRKTTAVA
jgi:hypothetical protein